MTHEEPEELLAVGKAGLGRADLLRLLPQYAAHRHAEVAAVLGYSAKEIEQKQDIDALVKLPSTGGKLEKTSGDSSRSEPGLMESPVIPFWQATSFEGCADLSERSQLLQGAARGCTEPDPPLPLVYHYLSSWRELEPRLHAALSHQRYGRNPDMKRLTNQISRGHIPAALPLESRKVWGENLYVIEDGSTHLAPYRTDVAMVQRHLMACYLPGKMHQVRVPHGVRVPMLLRNGSCVGRLKLAPGARVLIFSDLGLLAQDDGQMRKFWLRFGESLRQLSVDATVLMPCSPKSCHGRLSQLFRLMSWEHHAPPPVYADSPLSAHGVKRLLRLLSPALCFPPELLRSGRLSLGREAPGAAVESLVWQRCQINPELGGVKSGVTGLRAEFAAEEPEVIQKVLTSMRRWLYQPEQPKEYWFETVVALPELLQAVHVSKRDIDAISTFYAAVAVRSVADSTNPLNDRGRGYVARALSRIGEACVGNSRFEPAMQQLAYALSHWQVGREPEGEPTIIRYALSQQGDSILIERAHSLGKVAGSYLGSLASSDARFQIEPVVKPQFWASGQPPLWADVWGEDAFGRWVEFVVADVRQRMRWMPAGEFLMGSPESEAEWYSDEGPQHAVRISHGFWMFDTAVPQGLWLAVMGENPSSFKGDDLPVESVGWEDCQKFIEKINQLLPGLGLSLPSEAQWEYGCRAGTTTRYSFGDEINRELANYDDNERQTVGVQRYARNPWGLYQMHGNVYEWCLDGMRDYSSGPERDPLGSLEDGVSRALRGGCWLIHARDVRAAYRNAFAPDNRSSSIGFRCARVQVKSSPVAEPIEPGQLRSGTRSADPDQSGGAVDVQPRRVLLKATEQRVDWPVVRGAFELRSDMGRLLIEPLPKPEWATAVGRDQFGLWAEFTIEKDGKKVRQRMRWIPPGQFLMGSPEDEADEYRVELQHPVTISRGFWVFDTVVTQALWLAVMGENPSEFGGDDLPVESVTWNDCQKFIECVNNLYPALSLTLLTDSQWEYACRAGTQTRYSFGDAISPEYANYSGSSYSMTIEVKKCHVNPWGLWQMHGNVSEWCLDDFKKYDKCSEIDPIGSLNGSNRIVRGGGWISDESITLSAFRLQKGVNEKSWHIGFRCARFYEGNE